MRMFFLLACGAVLFGGCGGPANVRPSAASGAESAAKADETLFRLFDGLDLQSSTVGAMAKAVIASPADGALDPRLAALRGRIEQRLSAVDALKARGIVGEDDRGYLEARDNITPDEESIRSDENADRREIYQTIAMQTHDSIDRVGRLRAQRIAVLAQRGGWLKNPGGGGWYQKP